MAARVMAKSSIAVGVGASWCRAARSTASAEAQSVARRTGTNFNIGHIVQGLRLAYCTFRGIFLENASNCLVQNCLVSSIGITGGGVNLGLAYGISVFSVGGGTRVYRCQVSNATETGFVGVVTGGSQGSYFEQNLATHCNFGFAFGDATEAYRDNASFGSTTTAFNGGNDFGGNHSQ